jgi:hypothetical protein
MWEGASSTNSRSDAFALPGLAAQLCDQVLAHVGVGHGDVVGRLGGQERFDVREELLR